MIIWSHGQGWSANVPVKHISELSKPSAFGNAFKKLSKLDGKAAVMGGLGFDHDKRSHFTIPEISETLKSFSDAFHFSKPIDIYGSDACFMQMLEVAYEFKDVARYVIGSAQQEMFWGWPYKDILSHLASFVAAGPEFKILIRKWIENNISNHQMGISVDPDAGKDDAYYVAKLIPILYRDSYYTKDSDQGIDT